MKRLLVLFVLVAATSAKAENKGFYVDSNSFLHLGVSAGMTTGLYMVMSMPSRLADTREGRLPALIGSSMFAYALGTAFEAMDANGGKLDGSDMVFNAIGVLGAATTIYFVDIHGRKDKNVNIMFTGKSLVIGARF